MHVDLSMQQMALIARKSSRTIRRWCQLGFVKGARASRGGHWSVRVMFTKKDADIVRARARRAGGIKENFEAEMAARYAEKAFDAVRPPKEFERGRGIRPAREWTEAYRVNRDGPTQSIDPFTREKITLLPIKKAWEIAAAFEWSESVGFGQSLAPVFEKIKRLGFMPLPSECLDYPMQDEVRIALDNAGHKTLFRGVYGAARNALQARGKCSVRAACEKLGVSRATAYRHGAEAAVRLANKEWKKSADEVRAETNIKRRR